MSQEPWTDEEILTARVRLRAFAERDKPVIAVLWSDPLVRRYLGGPVDAGVVEGLVDAVVGRRPGVFCVADVATDGAIGSVSLSRERGVAEVSYELVPSAWGKALAYEAVSAFLAWVWSTHDDAAVIAVTQVANAPSRALLERLAFVEESRFEEFGAPQVRYRLARPLDGPTHDWSRDVDHEHLRGIVAAADDHAPGGVLHLLLEVLAYAAEESAARGGGGRCTVIVDPDGVVEVADDGRGTAVRTRTAPCCASP